jgi:transposase
VNKGVNVDIFCRLRDAVRTKHPEKWRTNSSFLPHNNAPAHWVVLIKDFLAENNVTTLENPPYPPDLAPADVHLFLLLKSALKGQCFCDAADIMKNARQSGIVFHKMASRNVSNTSTVAGRSV